MIVSSSPALRRVGTRVAAGAAAAALVVLATPAVASAADATLAPATATPSSGTVTPLLDCYMGNSDGSYTAILGYSSTLSATKSIPVGASNTFAPTTHNGSLPTSFKPGTNHAAFSVRVTSAEIYAGITWTLDGHTLDYGAAAYASGVCTPGTPLPAEGNGTGWTIALVTAGLVGGAAVWRGRSRSARAAAATAGPV